MGLFGVELDVARFSRNDRTRAALALAASILAQGHSATWLVIDTSLDPLPYISTFPIMPLTSVSGNATYVSAATGTSLTRKSRPLDPTDSLWYLEDAPKGVMDEDGYLHFVAQAVPLCEPVETESTTGKIRRYCIDNNNDSKYSHLAVRIGTRQRFNFCPPFRFANPVLLMVLGWHAQGRYHKIGFGEKSGAEDLETWPWKSMSVAVGGPLPIAGIEGLESHTVSDVDYTYQIYTSK